MKENKGIIVLISSIVIVGFAAIMFDKWLTKKTNSQE